MRLVVGALALTLFAAAVRAEDAKSPEPAPAVEASKGKVPLRVVRVMPESRQALLFDRQRSTHVLAEVGGTIAGYTVEDIDGDEVTLRSGDTRIVLVAPPRGNRRHAGEPTEGHARPTADVKPTDTAGAAAPEDPYGEGAIRSVRAPDAGEPAPSDPYAAEGARAIVPGEGGVRVARAPDAQGPSDPYAAVGDATSSAPPLAPGEGGVRVARAPDAQGPSDPYESGSSAQPLAPGEGGVRVARAPDAQGPSDPYESGSDAHPRAPGEGGVRVALAPDAPARTSTAQMPSDPYAAAGDPGSAPPSASTSGPAVPPVRSVSAAPGALPPHDGVRVVQAPGSVRSDGPKPDRRAVDAPGAPARASGDGVVLSRAEVDDALGNFASLAAAVRGSFSATGLVVAEVSEGSIFYRAGLRAGDVVTAVDGTRLRTLDDAANLYARASSAKAIAAQIVRGGKPMTIHVTIQ